LALAIGFLVFAVILLTGVNPASVRGSRTGVFVGCMISDALDMWGTDPERITGVEIIGATQSLFANRLSYFFDFQGLCVVYNAVRAYILCAPPRRAQ